MVCHIPNSEESPNYPVSNNNGGLNTTKLGSLLRHSMKSVHTACTAHDTPPLVKVPLHLPFHPKPFQLPPSPCESNTKVPKLDGNDTSCCSDKGVVCARRERTQEVTVVP